MVLTYIKSDEANIESNCINDFVGLHQVFVYKMERTLFNNQFLPLPTTFINKWTSFQEVMTEKNWSTRRQTCIKVTLPTTISKDWPKIKTWPPIGIWRPTAWALAQSNGECCSTQMSVLIYWVIKAEYGEDGKENFIVVRTHCQVQWDTSRLQYAEFAILVNCKRCWSAKETWR